MEQSDCCDNSHFIIQIQLTVSKIYVFKIFKKLSFKISSKSWRIEFLSTIYIVVWLQLHNSMLPSWNGETFAVESLLRPRGWWHWRHYPLPVSRKHFLKIYKKYINRISRQFWRNVSSQWIDYSETGNWSHAVAKRLLYVNHCTILYMLTLWI